MGPVKSYVTLHVLFFLQELLPSRSHILEWWLYLGLSASCLCLVRAFPGVAARPNNGVASLRTFWCGMGVLKLRTCVDVCWCGMGVKITSSHNMAIIS